MEMGFGFGKRTNLGVVLDAFLDDGRDGELTLGEHVGWIRREMDGDCCSNAR